MHETARTANLLGATVLALNDLALRGATQAANVSASGAAALVSLSAHPGLSVTELGRRVGLSQSAAARMVDSLQAQGLVERRTSPWLARMTSVHVTDAGHTAARRILAARGTPLTDLVSTLEESDQQALAQLLTKLLPALYEQIGNAQYLCRLCDRRCCTDGTTCPVGEAERTRTTGEAP